MALTTSVKCPDVGPVDCPANSLGCLTRIRTWSLLNQNQTGCQLPHEALQQAPAAGRLVDARTLDTAADSRVSVHRY